MGTLTSLGSVPSTRLKSWLLSDRKQLSGDKQNNGLGAHRGHKVSSISLQQIQISADRHQGKTHELPRRPGILEEEALHWVWDPLLNTLLEASEA